MPAASIRNRSDLLADVPAEQRKRRALALDLFDAALAEVEPRTCTRRALQQLREQGAQLTGCTVFAIGKAAQGMAEAALDELDVRDGLVLGFESGSLGPLTMLAASHPVPAAEAPGHGRQVLDRARSLGPSDVALVLISGGGSAMLELPAEGVSMAEIQQTTRVLLASGAEIGEVNAVRSALSQLKGGRLARALAPARVYDVVISDVIGSPLHAIASGPCVRPPDDQVAPVDLIERYGLRDKLPASVVHKLEQPVPRGEPADFAHVQHVIAADNHTAQRAMLRAARERGIDAELEPQAVLGEARLQGQAFVEGARSTGRARIGGGETTVTLRGQGRGGRNQECVLGAAEALGGGLFASMGTDGVDGASDDAGALLDDAALARAASLGLERRQALVDNDSNGFFRAVGTALHTGRTGTNVTDVCLWLP